MVSKSLLPNWEIGEFWDDSCILLFHFHLEATINSYMLRSDFNHIISLGPFHFLLGLSQPLIWFTCCRFHSQCNQRDKRNIILFFKSSHWLWNKISFHSTLYMILNIFLFLQPLALPLKTACLRFFCPYVNENHVFSSL